MQCKKLFQAVYTYFRNSIHIEKTSYDWCWDRWIRTWVPNQIPSLSHNPNLASEENNSHTCVAFTNFFPKTKKKTIKMGAGPLAPRTRGARALHFEKFYFCFLEKKFVNATHVWELFSSEAKIGLCNRDGIWFGTHVHIHPSQHQSYEVFYMNRIEKILVYRLK